MTRSRFPDLYPRFLSACLLIAMLFVILVIGGHLVNIFIAFVFALLVYEWVAIWWQGGAKLFIAVATLLGLSAWIGNMYLSGVYLLALSLPCALALAIPVRKRPNQKLTVSRLWFAIGFLYLGLFPLASFNLFGIPGLFSLETLKHLTLTSLTNFDGTHFLNPLFMAFQSSDVLINILPWGGLYVLSIVISADLGGYFGGRVFGGPKLLPALSPSKTWSGLITALVFAYLVTVLWNQFGMSALTTFQRIPSPNMNLTILALASVAGDMWQSFLKRRAGVKDSGQLLPGHGGVFDRLDGYIAAAALAWLVPLII